MSLHPRCLLCIGINCLYVRSQPQNGLAQPRIILRPWATACGAIVQTMAMAKEPLQPFVEHPCVTYLMSNC